MLDKLKKMADQAKEKAGPMAQQAKEKAGPMAEQAKEKATELASKAAPAVSQGVGKAAGSLDKATKGRYTEKIDKVQGAVQQTAQKVGEKSAGTGAAGAPTSQPPYVAGSDSVLSEPVSPVVIPAEPVINPTPPAGSALDPDPVIGSPSHIHENPEDKPKI
ncbi:MAG: antitoxin [Jatrophihabitantaceae bacterium]